LPIPKAVEAYAASPATITGLRCHPWSKHHMNPDLHAPQFIAKYTQQVNTKYTQQAIMAAAQGNPSTTSMFLGWELAGGTSFLGHPDWIQRR
jgi:hypothetical protein